MAVPSIRSEFTPRTYYVLRNKTSNMMYLGQTIQNIKSYLGSGVYWKKHCSKHGGYVRENIEILFQQKINSKKDANTLLKHFIQIYGEYWKLNDWANLVEENSEENPFYGPSLNDFRMRNGIHPWSKENITKELKEKQSKTKIGTEKFKNNLIEKYGVDNIMKLSDVAKRSGKLSGETKRKNKTAVGANNSNAKDITVNGIHFKTMKDASSYFNISMHYLRNFNNKDRNIRVDVNELQERTRRYGSK